MFECYCFALNGCNSCLVTSFVRSVCSSVYSRLLISKTDKMSRNASPACKTDYRPQMTQNRRYSSSREWLKSNCGTLPSQAWSHSSFWASGSASSQAYRAPVSRSDDFPPIIIGNCTSYCCFAASSPSLRCVLQCQSLECTIPPTVTFAEPVRLYSERWTVPKSVSQLPHWVSCVPNLRMFHCSQSCPVSDKPTFLCHVTNTTKKFFVDFKGHLLSIFSNLNVTFGDRTVFSDKPCLYGKQNVQ